MHNSVKRLLTLAATVMMLLSIGLMVASCTEKKIDITQSVQFPLEKNQTLSWWYPWGKTYTPDYASVGDAPFMKRLMEKTNITLDFVHPTSTSFTDQSGEYTASIASGNITDIVTHGIYFPDVDGGPIDDAIDAGIYIRLNELIDTHMPNFTSLRNKYSIIDKTMVTLQGNIIYIPKLEAYDVNEVKKSEGGLVIRKDMLDELQLAVPETVEEWYNVLKQLQVSGGVAAPFEFGKMQFGPWTGHAFFTAYGVHNTNYLDDEGKIHYGLVEDGMFEYLKEMVKWNNDGLLLIDSTDEDVKRTDDVAAWVSNANEVETLNKKGNNPNYNLVGVKYPTLKKGDVTDFLGQSYPIGSATISDALITKDCKYPHYALAMLDLMYTEESFNETSYGIKCEDYNMDDSGKVVFTEKVTGNKDGIRFGIEQNAFLGSFWHDGQVFLKYAYSDQTLAAIEEWNKGTTKRSILYGGQLTAEEQRTLADMGNMFMTYIGINGFINGDRPLTEWDSYVQAMNSAGIQEEIAIRQEAYERFLAS